MDRTVPFPRRDDDDDTLRRRSLRPETGTLADKLQRLVLTHPIAALEIEKFIDRLLAKDNEGGSHE